MTMCKPQYRDVVLNRDRRKTKYPTKCCSGHDRISWIWKLAITGYMFSMIVISVQCTLSPLRPFLARDGHLDVVVWTDSEKFVSGLRNETEDISWIEEQYADVYNASLIREIYSSNYWYNIIKNTIPLSSDIILVNCSKSERLGHVAFSSSKNCLCYDSDDINPDDDGSEAVITVKPCDNDSSAYFYYTDIIYGILKQSQWSNVITISDYNIDMPVIMPREDFLAKKTILSCNTTGKEIIHLIENSYSINDDFWNILFYCESSTTLNLLNETFALDSVVRNIRFNMLLVEITEEAFRKVQLLLRDGDNAVLLNIVENNEILQRVIQADYFQFIEPVRAIGIHWCYTDCFLGEPTTFIGLFTAQHDITHLDFELLPARFSQFYGRHLIVVCAEYRPFCVTERYADGSSTVIGVEVEIVKALSLTYNFTFHTIEPIDKQFGSKNEDGSWNGMVGMLIRKEAAIAVSGITVTAEREDVVDFLHPHWEEPSAIVVKLNSNKWRYFIETFSLEVWYFVFCLPLMIGLVLIVIHMANERIRGDNISKTPFKIQFVYQSYDYFFKVYGVMVLQGTHLQARYGSSRFVIAFFWFTVIMMTSVFSGNLTATLAVRKVKMPFQTLEQLANDRNYILQISKGTFREILFKESTQGVYRKLWEKIMTDPKKSVAPSREAAYEKVLEGGYTYTADKTALWEWVKQGGYCDLVFLPEFYFRSGLGIMVPEGSPYKKEFNRVIVNLLETGLVDIWYRNYSTRDVCNFPSYTTKSEPVTLHDITYVLLYILCLGLGIGTLALVCECFVTKTFAKRK